MAILLWAMSPAPDLVLTGVGVEWPETPVLGVSVGWGRRGGIFRSGAGRRGGRALLFRLIRGDHVGIGHGLDRSRGQCPSGRGWALDGRVAKISGQAAGGKSLTVDRGKQQTGHPDSE